MMSEQVVPERRGAGCLSDFALDRFRLGDGRGSEECPPPSSHLRGCVKCQARLAELEAVVAPTLDVSRLLPVAPQARGWRRWPALWLAPLALVAALVVLVPWRAPPERSKGGGWQLGLIAQHANGRIDRISSGDALAPGDRVRFEVTAPSAAFVSIISMDGAGAVTPFFPPSGTAAAISPGKQQVLEGAIRLDAALGPERLVLVACARRVDVTEVVRAGRAALEQVQGRPDAVATLNLPCTQHSFWIHKEVRP